VGRKPPSIKDVHMTQENLTALALTPPHPPREDSPIYRRAHALLIIELDSPCEICGVRHSTLQDPARNPYGATALETHHYPIEWSLANACDWRKVRKLSVFIKDQASFLAWIDSPSNLMVLCDIHHRSLLLGIHHLSAQDFAILPYLFDGYKVTTSAEQAQANQQQDQNIIEEEEAHGE
jgi:hypothetical protein